MSALPLFPVTTVGSWPRPPQTSCEAQRRQAPGPTGARRVRPRGRRAPCWTSCACRRTSACDIVTDGEQRRDNFYSFVAEKLDGVRLMTLAEMLDVVEDKAGLRAHAPDARCAGLRDQQCRSASARLRGASRWPSTTLRFVEAHTRIGRSR